MMAALPQEGAPVNPVTAPVEDRVELQVPADPAYLAVLRTATAGLAARIDLTLDEIEDLRIAVDEACALLLPHVEDAPSAATLTAEFEIRPEVLTVRVTGPATALPERSSFAWAVLEALVGHVETLTLTDGRSMIVLRHERVARSSRD
jgi:serine/threonine-protein kinase RsbW